MPLNNSIEQNKSIDQEDRRGFEVQLGAFSGPLDLLCHLVESREMNPANINLTELVSQYVKFLLEGEKTTLNEMAEFFAFASRLLLRKVHSLFPSRIGDDVNPDVDEQDYIETEEELQQMLENFRPYRNAAALLAFKQQQREKSFIRIWDEDTTPFYDLGDLYGLSMKWWELLEQYNERHRNMDYEENNVWDEIPDAVPEERQVEARMEELMSELKGKRIALKELLQERNKKNLIVTLLALLEMSRLGMVQLIQHETLGDVEIASA